MQTMPRSLEEMVLAHPGSKLEMLDGEWREKPTMTIPHNLAQVRLVRQLVPQIDFDRFDLRIDNVHLARPNSTFFIPDVCILDSPGNRAIGETMAGLETITVPCLLVAEIWSPTTGAFDLSQKIPEYIARGDREIWLLHPYDLTLTAWRQQPDGQYEKSTYQGGNVELMSIPGIVIDLAALFV
jgi:Uma2 family endonuclease